MKIKHFLCLFGLPLWVSTHVLAQVSPPPPPFCPRAPEFKRVKNDSTQLEMAVWTITDTMPSFAGGEKAMFKWLAENVKYPPVALEEGISGTVYVGFVVNTDGSISNIEVKRGIMGGLTEEAVRVIKAMPKWIPAIKNGKKVAIFWILPIKFRAC